MTKGRHVWKVIRYRRGQAALIVAVAALMTTCAVFGALYDRAIQQALAGAKLSEAPIQERGLTLSAQGSNLPTEESLADRLPDTVRGYFAEPSALRSVEVVTGSSQAELVSKAGSCAQLRFNSGDCPDQPGEVAVSAATAEGDGWQLGEQVTVTEVVTDDEQLEASTLTLTVVGVYDVRPGDFWFGRLLTGKTGSPADPESGLITLDDLVVDEGTLSGTQAPAWADARLFVSFPLDLEQVHVDELLLMGKTINKHTEQLATEPPRYGLRTGLPAIADDVEHGRDQAHVVVPLLMGQLALLALVVLWLVLGAAVTQRRPELALAQLRGRGARGAARWLLRELLPLVATGFVTGCALAVVLSWVARHLTLPANAPAEVPLTAVLAGATALGVLLAATGLAVLRVSREPVNSLLRRVPTRRSTWRVGAADAVLLSGSVVIVLAFATGSLTGPMAVVAPALLALSVGIGLAHLLTAVAAGVGRRLLRRGRYVAGVGASMVARQPSTRQLVTIVTVASALLVFSADALITAQHNRADAAAQQNGANAKATVAGNNLAGVRRALAEVDPGGERVTPIARITAPGGRILSQAVVPEEFRRIALFPGQASSDLPWADLAKPSRPPLQLTGGRLRLKVDSTLQISPSDGTTSLSLRVVDQNGQLLSVTLASLTAGKRTTRVDERLSCREGCTVVGFELRSQIAVTSTGTVTLSRMATDKGAVPLNGADWQPFDAEEATISIPDPRSGRLSMEVHVPSGTAVSRHAAVPYPIPALMSGPPEAQGRDFDGLALDGVTREMTFVGEVARVPAGEPTTVLVNLDSITVEGANLEDAASIWLLFADDDPAFAAKVDAALHEQGSAITSLTTLNEVRNDLDSSAAAWAVELAVLVGVASIGLAALAMLVIAATTLRRRSFDLAALRMSGVRTRPIWLVALGEQLAVAVIAVAAGATCGVIGADLAMPDIPLFAVTPNVSTIDLSTAWLAVLVATTVSLVVLTAAGGLAARAGKQRATLARLRETL